MRWFGVLKAVTNEPNTVNDFYVLKDKIWWEAGGNKGYADGKFEYAELDDIEEILGRKLTVNDFTSAPTNWLRKKTYIIDRIGEEGRKELARQYSTKMQGKYHGEARQLLGE